jgi:oxygen-independent coproporphyrinogen-3 oxidase
VNQAASGLGLYIHVPFCQAICGYCNFNRGLFDPDLKQRYVAALEREIREPSLRPDLPAALAPADTIFFGGGTPSLLEPAEIARLIAACRESFDLRADAEITLETNPETATAPRLAAFREAGVNRISFGVQSFDPDELKRLDRIHTADRAAGAVRLAREAGFDNLSFDLMFWLPGQSRDSWRRTVARAIELAPDHLSLYLLEIYPNAPLRDAMARAAAHDRSWAQAADDEAADMYLEALEHLETAGFVQYEISNVSRPGFQCRHNVKYWQGGDWVGLGCGAHSTAAGVRWRDVASTSGYVECIDAGRSPALDVHPLDAGERLAEALFMGLRMTDGVDLGNFRRLHGVDPWLRHEAELEPLRGQGLVWRRGDRFGLSREGMLVANEILAAFV